MVMIIITISLGFSVFVSLLLVYIDGDQIENGFIWFLFSHFFCFYWERNEGEGDFEFSLWFLCWIRCRRESHSPRGTWSLRRIRRQWRILRPESSINQLRFLRLDHYGSWIVLRFIFSKSCVHEFTIYVLFSVLMEICLNLEFLFRIFVAIVQITVLCLVIEAMWGKKFFLTCLSIGVWWVGTLELDCPIRWGLGQLLGIKKKKIWLSFNVLFIF